MKTNILDTAHAILRHPLDPSFKVRWMAQFTTEYLQEFTHVCRNELLRAHAKLELLQANDAKKSKISKALQRKRMIRGRLTAVVLELQRRGAAAPKLRVIS